MNTLFKLPFKPRCLASMMEKVLGLTEFEHRYKKVCELSNSQNFLSLALDEIGIKTEILQVEKLKKNSDKRSCSDCS